jgi:hypothetical protein
VCLSKPTQRRAAAFLPRMPRVASSRRRADAQRGCRTAPARRRRPHPYRDHRPHADAGGSAGTGSRARRHPADRRSCHRAADNDPDSDVTARLCRHLTSDAGNGPRCRRETCEPSPRRPGPNIPGPGHRGSGHTGTRHAAWPPPADGEDRRTGGRAAENGPQAVPAAATAADRTERVYRRMPDDFAAGNWSTTRPPRYEPPSCTP